MPDSCVLELFNYSNAHHNLPRALHFPGQHPAPPQQDKSEQIIVAVTHHQKCMQRAEKQEEKQNDDTKPGARLDVSVSFEKILDGKGQRQQQQTQIIGKSVIAHQHGDDHAERKT